MMEQNRIAFCFEVLTRCEIFLNITKRHRTFLETLWPKWNQVNKLNIAHKIYFVEVINTSAQNKLKTKTDMIQFLLFFLI